MRLPAQVSGLALKRKTVPVPFRVEAGASGGTLRWRERKPKEHCSDDFNSYNEVRDHLSCEVVEGVGKI